MSNPIDHDLHEARLTARREFVELARIYSGRQKQDPKARIAFAELQIELEESLARIAASVGKETVPA